MCVSFSLPKVHWCAVRCELPEVLCGDVISTAPVCVCVVGCVHVST